MKLTGASASTFFVSVLRPMRCCSSANGAGRPSFQTTISPSRSLSDFAAFLRKGASSTIEAVETNESANR